MMHILEIVDNPNLVSGIDQDKLDRIGASVVSDYDVDKRSMSDWMERNDLALKLIDQKPEPKSDPWPGAANTKLPLVLNAAMKASAEEYAEILRGDDLVKTAIFGEETPIKISRAQRVSKRMNFQFFHELEDWQEDHDKLIMAKNILGTVHKKYLYSGGKVQCVLRRHGIVINDNVEKIQDAPRITDELEKFWWQAEEKFRNNEWERIDLTRCDNQDFADGDKLNLFLEQIRMEDLDEDGYPEPYIVTVHCESRQVVRITPNFTFESIRFNEEVDADEYRNLEKRSQRIAQEGLKVLGFDYNRARVRYVKYDMIPSWEGGYWGFGFGILLGPLNENCNQLVNHLLNAGHLATNGGGFINSSIKMKDGELKFRSNEWKKVQSYGGDLSRNIVPLPVKEPSQTLFSLLGLLMDVLRELSSVTEVMSGEQPRANMPASSIMALIEQGKKLFNSVYKRHYRSLSKEMTALFDLNFLYEDPMTYVEFHDLGERMQIPEGVSPGQFFTALTQGDFSRDGLDVIPTASPEFSSRIQRMTEAQALFELVDRPEVNGTEVIRDYIIGVTDDIEKAARLVPQSPEMTPAQMMQQIQVGIEEYKASNEARKSEAEALTAEVKLRQSMAELEKLGIKIPLDLELAAAKVAKAGYDAEKAEAESAINE